MYCDLFKLSPYTKIKISPSKNKNVQINNKLNYKTLLESKNLKMSISGKQF